MGRRNRGGCLIAMVIVALIAAMIVAVAPGSAGAQEALRLHAPEAMIQNGFLTHLLPRFRFKHRIRIVRVAAGESADLAIVDKSDNSGQSKLGATIFVAHDDAPFFLVPLSNDPDAMGKIEKFRDWLASEAGGRVVEGFPKGGPPIYAVGEVAAIAPVAVTIDGDAKLGSRLALVHCGRCHVIDKRNRMGGIGSTPSFAAMRARPAWHELFLKFFTENPHPSFTQVEGVTIPFGPDRVAHIAPVEVTLDEIDAITAFVATLTPKDLGAPVRNQ